MNAELASRYPGIKATRDDLYAAIDQASKDNQICSKWYGALPSNQIAVYVADELNKLVPVAREASPSEGTIEENPSALKEWNFPGNSRSTPATVLKRGTVCQTKIME